MTAHAATQGNEAWEVEYSEVLVNEFTQDSYMIWYYIYFKYSYGSILILSDIALRCRFSKILYLLL